MADISRRTRNSLLMLGVPLVVFLVFLIVDRDRVRWLWTFDRMNVGQELDERIDWVQDTFQGAFDFITEKGESLVETFADALAWPSAVVFAAIATALVILLRSAKMSAPFIELQGVVRSIPLALFTFVSFRLVDVMNRWEAFTVTVAMIVLATILAVIIAVPVGIAAAHHRAVSTIVRPVLDFMQTLPSLLYLLIVVAFFGIGVVGGMFAVLVFSIPPGVRLTELGIRQVDPEVVEAAEAYGATKRQLLWGVKMPLALPTIMQGVNQIIMLGLAMVVIASFGGAPGLGVPVVEGVSRLDRPVGFEGGLSVVILAIFLDRVTTIMRDRVQTPT